VITEVSFCQKGDVDKPIVASNVVNKVTEVIVGKD
jgi:hypothetical protein